MTNILINKRINLLFTVIFFLVTCKETGPDIDPGINTSPGRVLFGFAGQSNMQGRGDKDASLKPDHGRAYEYIRFAQTNISLADPVGQYQSVFTEAATGSLLPAFARTYFQLSGKVPVCAHTAIGSSTITPEDAIVPANHWAPGGALFSEMINKFKDAERDNGLSMRGLFWLQGETDATQGLLYSNLPGSNFSERQAFLKDRQLDFFNALTNEMGEDFQVWVINISTHTNMPDTAYAAVRQNYREIADAHSNVSLVYTNTVDFPALGWMTDTVHYNQSGLNDIGTKIAQQIVNLGH